MGKLRKYKRKRIGKDPCVWKVVNVIYVGKISQQIKMTFN